MPTKHFRFAEEGITNDVIEDRRKSAYFIPIAQPRKKSRQQTLFETEWTQDRLEENRLVNRIRERVALWRQGGYAGVTSTTRRLLDYWNHPDRERKLFFCQLEALETAIYITEAARKYGDGWIENALREANDTSNPDLPRVAFKMATGAGKTVVMAMLIAWQSLNKLADPQNARFSDTFLIITPGITIRDRLRVLLPNDPENYYRLRDILPSHWLDQLGQARIVITNFHAFRRREKISAGKLTKTVLTSENNGAFTETPGEMVRRVCRELGTKKNIIVINDEAHHCYRRKPDGEQERLSRDDREVEKRAEEARIWISGIEAVKAKICVKTIFDLSATPFFLRGSGWPEGTLFPWVVSDFSLIDAIESGIVKVPRVPVEDNTMQGEQPTYRDLWSRIREDLPRKGRKKDAVGGEPKLPIELQGALHSLYGNYEKYYRQWEQNAEGKNRGATPPVFIVVCNNTNVSKLVFDYIAGWEKHIDDHAVVQAGALPVFRNDDGNGNWLHQPNTILVDSEQLESGEAMSSEFKKLAAREIEEFKSEYRQRFPGRDAEKLTDEDLLREVMNTVGKPGKLGEHIKCVVSVSMLTEGWDANTVTHVLGVRAFGTQLLCEQVVGRALRRMNYTTNEDGRFEPEYAQALEEMGEVVHYVKNHQLGFTIPYTLNGEEKQYYPDFIVHIDDGQSKENPISLIIEVTGEQKKDKAAKVTTAQTLWISAVNNHGGFGRWAFLEITDPWNAQNHIRKAMPDLSPDSNVALTIRKTPGVCGGRACVGATRIPVWLLISFSRQGATDEQLMEFYPDLTVEHLNLVRDYYDAHHKEIDRDIREQDEEEEEAPSRG